MDRQIERSLSQRYQYDDWQNQTMLNENLFLWQASLNDDSFPGWEPHSIRVRTPVRATVPAVAQPLGAMSGSYSIQSLWKRSQDEHEALMSVDLYHCVSRAAAHAFMLRLLGEFQSTQITRQKAIRIGDVMFSGRGRYMVVFARANLVLMMRNAGRNLKPVLTSAHLFDRALVTRPVVAEMEAHLTVPGFHLAIEAKPVAQPVPIEIILPSDARISKFYSSSGEVRYGDGGLIYEPTSSGTHELEVYAESPRGLARQTAQFTFG